jgi:hypothetical protein
VSTRGGWFSDRSASYLAAGRPVVIQDTGIGDCLPVGRGVLTFQTFEEAVAAVANLNSNYEIHVAYARQIVADYFDAKEVLEKLLNDISESMARSNTLVGKD